MTPEERAQGAAWMVVPIGEVDRVRITNIIATAIREAVAAEKEACALIADAEKRSESARDDRYHNACDEIAVQIRARTS